MIFVQDHSTGEEHRVDSPAALEPGVYIVGPGGDFYVGPFDTREAAIEEWDAGGRYDGERLHIQPDLDRRVTAANRVASYARDLADAERANAERSELPPNRLRPLPHSDLVTALKQYGAVTEPLDGRWPIQGTPNGDDWTCRCGNAAHLAGFYPCNADGVLVPPTHAEWDSRHWWCGDCGRVIDNETMRVVAVNIDPQDSEAVQ